MRGWLMRWRRRWRRGWWWQRALRWLVAAVVVGVAAVAVLRSQAFGTWLWYRLDPMGRLLLGAGWALALGWLAGPPLVGWVEDRRWRRYEARAARLAGYRLAAGGGQGLGEEPAAPVAADPLSEHDPPPGHEP